MIWKIGAAVALFTGAVTALPQEAQAQVGGIVPIRAKIGVFLPQDSEAKDFAGSTHINAEIETTLPATGLRLTAGYSQGSRGGRKVRMIPLTVSKVFTPPNPAAGVTGNVYFGLGVGAYLLRASGAGVSESKTTIGGFGVAGYQFPNAYFVEAKYHVVGKVGGVSPNGIALLLGRSF